jgi:hypothetical protein
MLKKNILSSLFCIFLIVPLVLGLSGCSFIQGIDGLNGIIEDPPDRELGILFQAEYAFFAGNYSLAEDLYLDIRESSEKPFYVNQAIYGLVCLAVITAKNTHELKRALVEMEKWQEPGVEVDGYGENPKMITTAISKQIALLDCKPEIRYVTTKKEGDLVKKYQEENEELKTTIKTLEHQISVLEAIDQEIQEKRKPI